MDNLYSEDDIIEITKHLKELVGKILMDDNGEFFTLKSFDIQGTDVEEFNLFKPNTTGRMFFINELVLEGAEGSYTHNNHHTYILDGSLICTLDGVHSLLGYHLNYIKLQRSLIKFTSKTGIELKFGKLSK